MRRPLAAILGLLGLPAAALAVELESGINAEGYWTDNVYSQTFDEVDDFSIRTSPWGELVDRDGEFTWGFRYQPAYEYWLEEDDVNGLDHDVAARAGWRVTPRTTLRVADRFQRWHSVARANEFAPPGEDIVVAGRRVEYKTNALSGIVEHWLTPRDLLLFNSSFTYQDFSEEGQFDRDFYGTSLVYRHRWSERATLGGLASWSRQAIDGGDVELADGTDAEDRETDYFNVSGLFLYAISPTLTFELSAGPALIKSDVPDLSVPATFAQYPRRGVAGTGGLVQFLIDADTCPRTSGGLRYVSGLCQVVSPPVTGPALGAVSGVEPLLQAGQVEDADDTTVTYFADIALVKQWERWRGEISYSRIEDRSTGFGAVSDVFYGNLSWQITRRFSAKVIASYEMRELSNEVPIAVIIVENQPTGLAAPNPILAARTLGYGSVVVESGSGLDVILSSLQLNYALTPRSSMYATFGYRDEQNEGDIVAVRDMQRFSVALGFSYVFDPIDLF